MERQIRTRFQKISTIVLIVAFGNAPFAFAQDGASADSAPTAAVPSGSDTSSSAPIPTTGSPAGSPAGSLASSLDSAAASSPDASNATRAPVVASASTLASTTAQASAVNPQAGPGVTVQDAYNSQPAVTADALESTSDPQIATSTTDISIPLLGPEASSTQASSTAASLPISAPIVAPPATALLATSTADIVAQGIDPDTVASVDAVDASSSTGTHDSRKILPVSPVAIAIAALTPAPQYEFALAGSAIPTKAESVASDGSTRESDVTSSLSPVLDNATGAITISGQCSDAYYVVLLFKNATDYAKDPSSYIVNRAYPCDGGAFSYSIKDLPHSLASGTYYLLVGQEGRSGGWKPVTALTPITITSNN